jgi:hypothetical protein
MTLTFTEALGKLTVISAGHTLILQFNQDQNIGKTWLNLSLIVDGTFLVNILTVSIVELCMVHCYQEKMSLSTLSRTLIKKIGSIKLSLEKLIDLNKLND